MSKFSFSIKETIMSIIDPLIKSLTKIEEEAETNLNVKIVQLTEGVTGSGKIIGKNLPDIVEINTVVVPTSHEHTSAQLPTSVTPVANTFVQRDNYGQIFSKGNSINDTGYKITDIGDISTLFEKPNQPYVTISEEKTGDGVLNNAWLTVTGKTIKLHTRFSDWCTYWDHCRCECCD